MGLKNTLVNYRDDLRITISFLYESPLISKKLLYEEDRHSDSRQGLLRE